MSDVTPVASSATPEPAPPLSAADQAVVSGDMTAFREARRAERAGTPLEPSIGDSAPPAPDDQAASTDATPSPASEPGKTTGHKGNAETRVQELLAERAQLRRELEQARQPRTETKTADSSPAPAPAGSVVYPPELASVEAYTAAHPDASYEDYLDARADVRLAAKLAARDQEQQARAAMDSRQRAFAERGDTFKARIADVAKSEPAFWSKVSESVTALQPSDVVVASGGQVGPLNVLADEIMQSEQGPQIMLHLSDHPEELQQFAALPYQALLKRFGALEHRLATKSAPDPAPKTVTDAPRPPRTVGHRAVDSGGDDLEAAVKAGDMEAFKAARRRERAAAERAR